MRSGFVFSAGAKDTGLAKLLSNLKQARAHVKVGVLAEGDGANKNGKLTVAEIAAIHEFGSRDGKIPERSFMRATLTDNRAAYIEILRKLVARFYAGKLPLKKLLAIMGTRLTADMKKKISTGSGVPPPLAPSTLRRRLARLKSKPTKSGKPRKRRKLSSKGHRPLVDTAQLIRAITYAVILKGAP
jgi:hypothetical protein